MFLNSLAQHLQRLNFGMEYASYRVRYIKNLHIGMRALCMLDRIFLVLFAKLVIPAGAQGLIYELTKAIFGDAEKFKVIDRIFWDVLLSNWVEQEPAIPCHEGALHYFKENHIRQNFKSFAGAR